MLFHSIGCAVAVTNWESPSLSAISTSFKTIIKTDTPSISDRYYLMIYFYLLIGYD